MLINNAGFGAKAPLSEMDLDSIHNMMSVNMCVLTELTRLLLPDMLARKSGYILNMASTSAYQPGPLMAIYFASKSYVLSLSQALSAELKGTGVSVTALCPGPTISAFAERAELKTSPIHNGTIPLFTPEQVAEQGYQAMMRRKRVFIVGRLNAFFAYIAAHLAPTSWTMSALKKLHGK